MIRRRHIDGAIVLAAVLGLGWLFLQGTAEDRIRDQARAAAASDASVPPGMICEPAADGGSVGRICWSPADVRTVPEAAPFVPGWPEEAPVELAEPTPDASLILAFDASAAFQLTLSGDVTSIGGLDWKDSRTEAERKAACVAYSCSYAYWSCPEDAGQGRQATRLGLGDGHTFCAKPAPRDGGRAEAVDLGAPDRCYCNRGEGSDFDPQNTIRGVPYGIWKARCHLWVAGEYTWPADAGVKIADGGSW